MPLAAAARGGAAALQPTQLGLQQGPGNSRMRGIVYIRARLAIGGHGVVPAGGSWFWLRWFVGLPGASAVTRRAVGFVEALWSVAMASV